MICKSLFRLGVITAVAAGAVVGGSLLIAGPQRTKAVFDKVQGGILQRIDHVIDDPTALRSQLEELEREYPARIAEVRGDLAELSEQIRQLEREQAICERVVELADADLALLEPVVKEAAAKAASGAPARANLVSFEDHVYTYDHAAAKLAQVRHTRVAYQNRAGDAAHDLTYLEQQANRLSELLVQLENERAQFQSQIMQLSRQVDAIERNERLIELLDKRNRTIEECSRYDIGTLDQLTARLAEIRTRQEAELDHLANSQRQLGYEDMARIELQREMESQGATAAPSPRSVAFDNE